MAHSNKDVFLLYITYRWWAGWDSAPHPLCSGIEAEGPTLPWDRLFLWQGESATSDRTWLFRLLLGSGTCYFCS